MHEKIQMWFASIADKHISKEILERAMVFFLAFCLLTLKSVCFSYADTSNNIIKILKEMEYEDIVIDDCNLSFFRSIEPTKDNNSAFAYGRFVNLRDLKDFERSKVDFVFLRGRKLFRLSAEFRAEIVMQRRSEERDFINFIHSVYGDVSWPFGSPAQQSDMNSVLEHQFRKKVPSYKKMSRWVDFSKYGPATTIEYQFLLTSLEREKLVELKKEIMRYITKYSCNKSG